MAEQLEIKWMIVDSMGQTYGPFDSYDKAGDELVTRGWKSINPPEFNFDYVLIGRQGYAFLYARIVTLKTIKTISEIPTTSSKG